MSDLIKLEEVSAQDLFMKGDGVDVLLEKITKEAKSLAPDISTNEGRKAIASMALKVAKSKTYLDDLGKDLVSEWKEKSKLVDNSRKKIRDYLDELKEEVRKPLTDWENKEKSRIENHEKNILKISSYYLAPQSDTETSVFLKGQLSEVEKLVIDDTWQEFKDRAEKEKGFAVYNLQKRIEKATNREKEQAELARLRQEAADREKKEREEKIAQEAKEKAELEAKKKIEAEEREKLLAIERQKKAEEELAQAKIKAALDKERAEKEKIEAEKQAVKKEQERQEALKKKEAEEIAKREANLKHVKNINNQALSALIECGLSEDMAKLVITAITQKKIPNVVINY